MRGVIRYVIFLYRAFRFLFKGNRTYWTWLGVVFATLCVGGYGYYEHVVEGLIVTNMTDQVSWGIGVANFVFFVGVAAAPVLIVVPAYVFQRKDMKEVVILGQLLAFVAVTMCLLFIVSDMGAAQKIWHLFPPFGLLNLPSSLLAWDVVVFNGYIVLNLYIPGYLLYKMYAGHKPRPLLYIPLVFVSIGWAEAVHTVTAFLLSGLESRYFWSSALLAPRFLISAGASGPALLILIFWVVRQNTKLKVKDSVFNYLRIVLAITMPVNLFLVGCEFFQEVYTGSLHNISGHYLFFGLEGHNMLTPFIWTAIACNVLATIIFLTPKLYTHRSILFLGCLLTTAGIWTEKGMGLIFPGFTPSPLGEVVEYAPNAAEIMVVAGVLAIGALIFTLAAKIAIGVQTGDLHVESNGDEKAPEPNPRESEPLPAT